MLGVLVALIALSAGWAACRLLRCGLELAPALGIALLAVLATWSVALGLPPVSALGVALVLVVVALASRPWTRGQAFKDGRVVGAVVVVATIVPAVVLGVTFASLDAPISNHDGAYHVERIASLLRGQDVAPWYPMGFHAALAAVLGLAPWVNTARGVLEAAQGLSIVAPLAVCGLARRLGAPPLAAALAGVIQAVSFLYPYDFHLWGGWPLGMGVILALGIWTVALAWLERPALSLAVAAGILLGAVVLTHGTELYTAAVGLLVIAAMRWRSLPWPTVVRHVPVAALLGVVAATWYLPRLLGWAQAGGASAVGGETLESMVLDPSLQGGGLWVQVGLGIVGGSSFLDAPVRVVLIVLGLRQPCTTLTRALWLTFVGLLVVVTAVHLPLLDRLYAATFPWLADQRLLQICTVFGSVLAGRGLVAAFAWLHRQRLRMPPLAARRALIAAVIVAGFFAEGALVSVWKRLDNAATEEAAFTSDDRAAMAWLRANAAPRARVANDGTADAGVWAPYAAGLPIVAPRTTSTPEAADVLAHITDPGVACSAGVRYVYYGSRVYDFEQRRFQLPSLQQHLREVFRSGVAVVFQTEC